MKELAEGGLQNSEVISPLKMRIELDILLSLMICFIPNQVCDNKVMRCIDSAGDSCMVTPSSDYGRSNSVYNNDLLSYDVYATACSLEIVTRSVEINGFPVTAICDTDAELNVLPDHCVPDLSLESTTVSLSAWGNFEWTVRR